MAVYRPVRDRLDRLPALLGPPPWRCADVVAAGWSWTQVHRAVAAGGLVRVSHGLVAPSNDVPLADLVRELLAPLRSTATASHATAGELHEQWVPRRLDALVHATVAGAPERTQGLLRIHGSRLSRQYVTELDGVQVTTPARTALDLGRGRRLPDALVALDGAARRLVAARLPHSERALRLGTVPADILAAVEAELREAYAEVWSWPGTRVLRQGLDLLDPRSESPFESWSRGCLLASGVPPFEVNGPVRGASGRLYYGDFVWRCARLIGEADGMAKYGGSAVDQRRRLQAQRQREDDLMADGWRITRWVTGESPRTLTSRVHLALAQPRVTA
jgi:hypothetical protein